MKRSQDGYIEDLPEDFYEDKRLIYRITAAAHRPSEFIAWLEQYLEDLKEMSKKEELIVDKRYCDAEGRVYFVADLGIEINYPVDLWYKKFR